MIAGTFLKKHVIAISLIIIPIVTPVEIATSLYYYYVVNEVSEIYAFYYEILPLSISLATYPIYSVGVVYYIAAAISGDRLDTFTAWRLGLKFWARYLALVILVGIFVVFGLMLLIIPGLILIARYAFTEFELLLNNHNPISAMKISWHNTTKYQWLILMGYLIVTLCISLPYFFIVGLFDDSSIFYWVFDTVSNVLYSLLGAFYTIFAFRVYSYSKMQNEENS